MEPTLINTTIAQVLTLTTNPALDVFTSIERVLPTHKLRCDRSIENPGGGGVNVARVLHRLGSNVKALYPVGGVTGRWHESLMKEEGIKPSLSELNSLSPKVLNAQEDYVLFCRSLIEQKKAEVIALTLGEEGAILVTQSQSLYAAPIKVEIKTTIGAGDSFVGAMTWSLLQGHDVPKAFSYGMAGGAAALLNSGTSLCQRGTVLDLVNKVELVVLGGAA